MKLERKNFLLYELVTLSNLYLFKIMMNNFTSSPHFNADKLKSLNPLARVIN